MEQVEYVEDVLNKLVLQGLWSDGADCNLEWQDYTILSSLNGAVVRDGALTQKQSRLLLKILAKYKNKITDFDIASIVDSPKWRYDFRKLDLSRAVWIETNEDGIICMVLKFPYELLKEFETVVESKTNMIWDSNRKVRKLPLYDFNIVTIDEFARKHNFSIDGAFTDMLHRVEEIWQQHENIKPYSKIVDGQVVLINSNSYANEYFLNNSTGQLDKDMFLAKSMCFPVELDHKPESVLEKVVQDERTHFWLKTNKEFLQLYQTIDGIAAVVIDRNTKDIISWLDQFLKDSKDMNIDTSLFRVCFRESKDDKSGLNSWISQNNLGGKIQGARLYFFKHAPPKWLFKDDIDVKIVATNSYTPVHSPITSNLLQSHGCVCHITDIKPTQTRNRQIANL